MMRTRTRALLFAGRALVCLLCGAGLVWLNTVRRDERLETHVVTLQRGMTAHLAAVVYVKGFPMPWYEFVSDRTPPGRIMPVGLAVDALVSGSVLICCIVITQRFAHFFKNRGPPG